MKLEDGMEKALWNDREYIASKVTEDYNTEKSIRKASERKK